MRVRENADDQTSDLTKALRDGIHDPNPEIRSAVLNLLDEMGEQAPVALLAEIALTEDSNPRVIDRAKALIQTMQAKEKKKYDHGK